VTSIKSPSPHLRDVDQSALAALIADHEDALVVETNWSSVVQRWNARFTGHFTAGTCRARASLAVTTSN